MLICFFFYSTVCFCAFLFVFFAFYVSVVFMLYVIDNWARTRGGGGGVAAEMEEFASGVKWPRRNEGFGV